MKRILLVITALVLTVNSFGQVPNWAWARSAGGINQDDARFNATDGLGNNFVVGYFLSDTITFGNNVLLNSSTTGTSDIYLVKYNDAGNVIWAKSFGNIGDDYASSIKIDASGNIYIVGGFNSSNITFGSFTLTNTGAFGTEDIYVLKCDGNGNAVWANSAGGASDDQATSVAINASGDVYVTGIFGSLSIQFDATILTNAGNVGENDIFIVEFDVNGNVIWAKREGGISSDVSISIVLDFAGNFYITGRFYSSNIIFGADTLTNAGTAGTNTDMFLVKYDSAGNDIWAKRIGGSSMDQAGSVAVDPSGNVIVTGYFISPTIIIGTDTLTNSGSYDILVAKFDSGGNLIWAKSVGGIGDDEGWSIVTDILGNVYVSGLFRTANMAFGSTTLVNTCGSSIFILKYDINGNAIWGKSAGVSGDNAATSIAIDGSGNLYVVGYLDGSIIFGSTTLTTAGNYDMFIAVISPLQNVWPGDGDNSHIVDNTDLLPIGLYYGQTGVARTIQGNAWQADSCIDWGVTQTNGFDIKHADCNGDGTIDNNDTLAVNLNFNLTHAIHTIHVNEQRTLQPNLYFVTSSNHYNAGDMVDVELWAGSAAMPVSSLYGIAFNIDYDAYLVQSGTENLSYPASWLGTPGTDAIKIGKTDELATTAYGAETRITHTNASGFGKIADFTFQVNTALTLPFTLNLSISNYLANDSAGAPKVFNTITDSLLINASTLGINKLTNENGGISIYPNPFTSETTITFSDVQKNTIIYVRDVLGREVNSQQVTGNSAVLDMSGQAKGIYFVQITDEKGNVINKKIVAE